MLLLRAVIYVSPSLHIISLGKPYAIEAIHHGYIVLSPTQWVSNRSRKACKCRHCRSASEPHVQESKEDSRKRTNWNVLGIECQILVKWNSLSIHISSSTAESRRIIYLNTTSLSLFNSTPSRHTFRRVHGISRPRITPPQSDWNARLYSRLE
jgi:hypothetical protein